MKKAISLLAAAAVAAQVSAAVPGGSSLSGLLGSLGIPVAATWHPEKIVTQTYDPEGAAWTTTATTSIAYDDAHRPVAVRLTMSAEEGVSVALGYESASSSLPDTVTLMAFGTPQVQYHVTYDKVVATYPVKIETRGMAADGDWTDWAVALDVEVKRDDKGRVTSVEPKVMKIDGLPVEYEKIEVKYGEGEYPVSLKSYSAEPRKDGSVKFEEEVSLTDMAFEACDNQILMLTDLYRWPNRLTACNMTDDDECNLKMSWTYGEDGSYVAEATGTEDGEEISRKMEMTYTDSYGSYKMSQTTTYNMSGYFEEEYERVVYNEFGLIEESETYEHSTDPDAGPLPEESFIKGTTKYWDTTDLPCMYVRSVKVDGTETFAPVMRQLFDGYEPSTGIAAPSADAPSRLKKGIFTIGGRRVSEGSALAPGFYIIDGIKTLVR